MELLLWIWLILVSILTLFGISWAGIALAITILSYVGLGLILMLGS